LNGALSPAFRVRGRFKPVMVKPDPVIDVCEIFAGEPPEFVMVPDCVWLLPTDTVPKLIPEEFRLS
jgi:hypothetical protein